MENFHTVNIVIHVAAGILALIAGFAALFVRKGGRKHTRFGRAFTWTIAAVVITGLIGVFVFGRNNFLLVITLLSGYNCYSGIRVMRLNGKSPRYFDYLAAVIAMTAAGYYLYYLHVSGLYWSPVIIYTTLGALFLLTLYDCSKAMFPPALLKKAVLYEHAYKMISAFGAITSAFSGTVLPQYKPYSQFLPSVIGFGFIMITFIRLSYINSSYIKRNTV